MAASLARSSPDMVLSGLSSWSDRLRPVTASRSAVVSASALAPRPPRCRRRRHSRLASLIVKLFATALLITLGRLDHDPAIGTLAVRFRYDVGFVGQRHVHDAPLRGRHRVEFDGVAGLADACSGVEGRLPEAGVAPAFVTSDVDVHTHAGSVVAVDDGVGQVLERGQGPAGPADDLAGIAAVDLDEDLVVVHL